jgi:hypothetical protein
MVLNTGVCDYDSCDSASHGEDWPGHHEERMEYDQFDSSDRICNSPRDITGVDTTDHRRRVSKAGSDILKIHPPTPEDRATVASELTSQPVGSRKLDGHGQGSPGKHDSRRKNIFCRQTGSGRAKVTPPNRSGFMGRTGTWTTQYLDFTKDTRRNDGGKTPCAANHKIDDTILLRATRRRRGCGSLH